MMTLEYKLADALRVIALRLEHALESGRRSTRIDANDLLETSPEGTLFETMRAAKSDHLR